MEPSIGWAPGAEDNPLAVWVAKVLEENLRRSAQCRSEFAALRAAVAMVARDRRISVTLRFDHGRLTIHDGMVGIPDVTFCGDYTLIVGLSDLRLTKRGRLPLPPSFRRTGPGAVWRRTLLDLVSGELKIYGLSAHPRRVLRLLRVLSAPRPER